MDGTGGRGDLCKSLLKTPKAGVLVAGKDIVSVGKRRGSIVERFQASGLRAFIEKFMPSTMARVACYVKQPATFNDSERDFLLLSW